MSQKTARLQKLHTTKWTQDSNEWNAEVDQVREYLTFYRSIQYVYV